MIAGFPCGGIDDPNRDESVSRWSSALTGWALDATAPLRAVLLTMGDRVIATAELGLPRPEIAKLFPNVPHAATCGWHGVVDPRQRLQGGAVLGITALTAAGDAIPLASVEIQLPREAKGLRRPRCVFTVVQNEPQYLPLWLSYYGRHFDAQDIFVLDHDTGDGSTAGLHDRCNVVPVHRGVSFDHGWLKGAVESFQSFLLRSYETVLFAEVDEFVVANPSRYAGLADYIQRMPGPMARCLGFEVVQDPEEAALRFDQPLLMQRSHWRGSPFYAKTLLSKVPLTWFIGFHQTQYPASPAPDPDLILAHLHRVDYEYCQNRHAAAARRTWNDADMARGDGHHNRIFEPAEFRKWFYVDADVRNAPRERIPDIFRKVF